MALEDLKKPAKKLAAVLNLVAVAGASAQASGVLASLSPALAAVVVGVLAVLNAIVHALPTPDA